MLLAVAMISIGLIGYHAGLTETRPLLGMLLMAVTVTVGIVGVIDLDQSARGLIQVPVQSLIDVAKEIQQ